MNNLLEYSGVVTKIRAMQKNLLTDDDFREIVAMPDVAAVEAYLKKNPAYAEAFSNINENDIHREALEAVFGSNVYRDFAKIYNFADPDQEKFLKKYARRYEIKLLKKCLKYAIAGRAPGDEILWHKDFFKKFLSLDVEALHECTSLDMTLKAVENTEYYPVLMRVRNGGRADFAKRHLQAGRFRAVPHGAHIAPLRRDRPLAVLTVPRLYEFGKAVQKSTRANRAERQTERLGKHVPRIVAFEHQQVAHEPRAFDGASVFAHYRYLAFKAKFQRNHAHDPHQETVERAYERKVLARNHLAQHRGEVGAGQRQGQALRLFGGDALVCGGFGQALDEAVEYLSGGHAGEGQRDNSFRLHAAEDQS